MKFVSALIAIAFVLTAQVAEAKPKAKAKQEAQESKEAFACSITEIKMIGVPDHRGWMNYDALVRMSCKNPSSKLVRLDVAHVFLEDEEYEYDASSDIDVFNSYYGNSEGTVFARRYVDVAPRKSADFVFFFEAVNSEWAVGLVLDINGTKYPLPVVPH